MSSIISNEKNSQFFTKEEIIDIISVSIHTLNNWIKEMKPLQNEIEIGRQNRRRYSVKYLIRIFRELKRSDLIKLIEHNKNLVKDESKTNALLVDGKSELNNSSVAILAKDETIKEIRIKAEALEKQLKERDDQINKLLNLLQQQQTLLSQQQTLQLQQTKITNQSNQPFQESEQETQQSNKKTGFLSWFNFKK